jgi:hypothetical protein
MALEYYQAFKEPSPYEQERLKAERLRRYAELLEQQGGEPEGEFTYQGIRAMPSPAAALGKMLQAYTAKKAGEKAEQAEAKSRQADIEGYESLQRELAPRQQVAAPTTPEIAASVGMPQISEEGAVSYQPGQQAPMRTEMVSPSVRERDDMLMRAMATGTPTAQRYAQLMLARQPQVGIEAIMQASPETRKKYQETGDPFVLAKPEEAAKPVTRIGSEDLGDRVRTYFSDGTFKDTRKGVAPTAAKEEKPQAATEGERKDAYNLGRIVNSANQIQAAIAKEPEAVRPGFGEAALGALPFGAGEGIKYKAQSPQRQIIDAAQTDLIDAALTLATGAAYTEQQLAGQIRSLIPRYGESDESIAAKDERLRQLMSDAKVRAGRAWTPELDAKLAKLFPALAQDQVIDLPPRR